MISYGGGDGEGLFFDPGFLGDKGRLLKCLHHAYLEVLVEKWWPERLLYASNNFQEGFGHSDADQNRSLKR